MVLLFLVFKGSISTLFIVAVHSGCTSWNSQQWCKRIPLGKLLLKSSSKYDVCYQRGHTPDSRSDTRDPNPVPGGRDTQAEWWLWAKTAPEKTACLEARTDQGTSQEMNGPSQAAECSQGKPGEGDADEPAEVRTCKPWGGGGACKPCHLSHHSLLRAGGLRSKNIIVFSRDYLKCRMRAWETGQSWTGGWSGLDQRVALWIKSRSISKHLRDRTTGFVSWWDVGLKAREPTGSRLTLSINHSPGETRIHKSTL